MHKDAGALVIALRYNLHIPAKRSTGIASDALQRSEGRHARLQGKRIAHPFFQHGCGGIFRCHVAPHHGKAGGILNVLPAAGGAGNGHKIPDTFTADHQAAHRVHRCAVNIEFSNPLARIITLRLQRNAAAAVGKPDLAVPFIRAAAGLKAQTVLLSLLLVAAE